MTKKEWKRYDIINEVYNKRLTQKHAAEILGITDRQVRNLVKRLAIGGIEQWPHRLRGRPSARSLAFEIKDRIVQVATTAYSGFGPTFISELLKEHENINISRETVRKILIQNGIWQAKKIREKHRQYRERRANRGELIQLDGSLDDWFGTGTKSWLISFVDDATSETFLVYAPAESTIELMKALKAYIMAKGIPLALYVDQDSIYRTTRQPDIEEQLRDQHPLTQFTRAAQELGIQVICANSPQAKGRVERNFRTHQDRLIKNNRLRGFKNAKEGAEYLKEYTKRHNAKFAVNPKNELDMHQPNPGEKVLNKVLCIKEKRSIANDFTVRYKNHLLQIAKDQKIQILKRNGVTMETDLNGQISMRYQNQLLDFEDITNKQRTKVVSCEKYSCADLGQRNKTVNNQKNIVPIADRKTVSQKARLTGWHKTNSMFFRKRQFKSIVKVMQC